MRKIYINPLSVDGQGGSEERSSQIVSKLLEVLDVFHEVAQSDNCEIYLDQRFYLNQLVTGQHIKSTLNKIDPETKRRFFYFEKNILKPLGITTEREISIALQCIKTSKRFCEGKLDNELAVIGNLWLSMIGLEYSNAEFLKLALEQGEIQVENTSDADNAKKYIPLYKANPKHRRKPYFDYERNEQVSAMPFSDSVAQTILNRAKPSNNGSDLFGFHPETAKYVRFKKTGGNIYHGFEIEPETVPNEVKAYFSGSS